MNNLRNYNPDVLSCLANLSNDEVFTPPQLANQILSMPLNPQKKLKSLTLRTLSNDVVIGLMAVTLQ
jgi:hypothetical protein